jgi:hypothetical protein
MVDIFSFYRNQLLQKANKDSTLLKKLNGASPQMLHQGASAGKQIKKLPLFRKVAHY